MGGECPAEGAPRMADRPVHDTDTRPVRRDTAAEFRALQMKPRYWVDDDRRIVWRVDHSDPARWAMRWRAGEGWHRDPDHGHLPFSLLAIGQPDYIHGPIPEAEALQITGPLPESVEAE